MKKLLAMVLATVMAVTCLTVFVSAEETYEPVNIIYSANRNENADKATLDYMAAITEASGGAVTFDINLNRGIFRLEDGTNLRITDKTAVIKNDVIGKILNVQVRFACPPRDVDRAKDGLGPWRLNPEIAGGGYFYDLAPHQFDLLQDLFGIIVDVKGICSNRGSGSWCFVGHPSAQDDSIEVIGERGMLTFSVFNYNPIQLVTSAGASSITVPNPPYVQLPIIKAVIEHLQGINVCNCTSVSATPVNWVMDRILGKF